jgi:glycosyltransferase involved in cell wall biosynthesis
MTATVIIPTTGSEDLVQAVESVLNQTYDTICYVVCDGMDHFSKVAALAITHNWTDNSRFKSCTIPINVGANGFYGHRIYAGFTHLINTEYVLYLDQDCWIDTEHVQTCIDTIKRNNLDWTYSLRKIVDKDGLYICNDDCESLGKWKCFQDYHHIDTNNYCIKTSVAIRLASAWHGGWGQDRVFFNTLSTHFQNFDCTGEYTVNYRLAGNEGSVKDKFFEYGNAIMNQKYNGELPWRKKI